MGYLLVILILIIAVAVGIQENDQVNVAPMHRMDTREYLLRVGCYALALIVICILCALFLIFLTFAGNSAD